MSKTSQGVFHNRTSTMYLKVKKNDKKLKSIEETRMTFMLLKSAFPIH